MDGPDDGGGDDAVDWRAVERTVGRRRAFDLELAELDADLVHKFATVYGGGIVDAAGVLELDLDLVAALDRRARRSADARRTDGPPDGPRVGADGVSPLNDRPDHAGLSTMRAMMADLQGKG